MHTALIAWTDQPDSVAGLEPLRVAVSSIATAVDAPLLFVAEDESAAWAWVATDVPLGETSAATTLSEGENTIALAIGNSAPGIAGFRRSHEQAVAARAVALAAGGDRQTITPFRDVAPIAMLCHDLEGARAWVHDTLGDLAVASSRNAGLRETARVFLRRSGSYTATAEELFLHRNTAQYRIAKAEEERGRPLRDDRLAVEIALLACHWLGDAVLRPPT